MAEKKTRQVQFELLRIVAMMMVVTLHYLNKGGVAVSYANDTSVINYIAWFVKSFCIIAVNAYVLLSGYFLMDRSFQVKRIISLILQVLFYGIVVTLAMYVLGRGNVESFTIYEWIQVIVPIQTEAYWFITSYIVALLFAPVVAKGVAIMEKKELQITIGCLLLFFSVGKSMIPLHLATDKYGYDFGWFLCLFLIAGYMKRFGIPFFSNKRKSFSVYAGCSVGIFLLGALMGLLGRYVSAFQYYGDMVYAYNYLLVLISAIAFFYGFSYIRIPKGMISKLIEKVAPLTLGVYLLHEHMLVRNMWPTWVQVENYRGTIWFIPHMICMVMAVFLVGILVEYVRQWVFKIAERGVGNDGPNKS